MGEPLSKNISSGSVEKPSDSDSREVPATKNSNLSENGDHYEGHRNIFYYGDLLTCRKENSCL